MSIQRKIEEALSQLRSGQTALIPCATGNHISMRERWSAAGEFLGLEISAELHPEWELVPLDKLNEFADTIDLTGSLDRFFEERRKKQ